MKNVGFAEQQKPLSMFAKMFADSTMFYSAAKAAWNEATRLSDENKESQRRQTEGINPIFREIGCDRPDTFHIRLESALTVATMNYCIAIELLMKAFIGVNGRFDQDSLDVMRKVSHKTEEIFKYIPEDCAQMEVIYQTAEMEDTEVAVFWSGWNPPNGEWIEDTEEDTQRLAIPTLKKFLCFLSTEKIYADRYSFEKFSNNDWRFKLCESQKIESFQHEIEKMLLEKAEENECLPTPLIVSFDLGEDQIATMPEVLSISSRAIFQLDKAQFGQTK